MCNDWFGASKQNLLLAVFISFFRFFHRFVISGWNMLHCKLQSKVSWLQFLLQYCNTYFSKSDQGRYSNCNFHDWNSTPLLKVCSSYLRTIFEQLLLLYQKLSVQFRLIFHEIKSYLVLNRINSWNKTPNSY